MFSKKKLQPAAYLAGCILTLGASAVVAEGQGDEITKYPMMPTSILEAASIENEVAPKKEERKSKQRSVRDEVVTMRANSEAFVIDVETGINQVIPIALGHINRIVTPFDTPSVNTISDATIEANENVLYVATNSELPITMFIKPDVDDESHALSLTLSPKKIPPIDVRLNLTEGSGNYASSGLNRSNKKAEKWEKSQPYTEAIKNTMRGLALGELPPGYSLGPYNPGQPLPTCVQEGLNYDFLNGQFLKGSNFDVSIGVMTNTSSRTIEFKEEFCINGNIIAVSSWPKTFLKSGDKSEIYVMMRNDLPVETTSKRRSLLED